MAELTNLETKLGEVIGLAMAAQASIDRISKLANGDPLAGQADEDGAPRRPRRRRSGARSSPARSTARSRRS